MGHLSEFEYDDRWDEREPDDQLDYAEPIFGKGLERVLEMQQMIARGELPPTLTDPLDDGTIPLTPAQFDPLCEVKGRIWPSNEIEAAGYEHEFAHGQIL